MSLLQLIELAGEALSRWAGAHPVRAVPMVARVLDKHREREKVRERVRRVMRCRG